MSSTLICSNRPAAIISTMVNIIAPPMKDKRGILRVQLFEITCLPCGIQERCEDEDEAIIQAYNHERNLTHSTSSGYFVSVNEV
jgi:hypothetical protein